MPNSSGLAGGGSTHAWVQAYLPGAGWIDFDPTNSIVGNRNLIRVAVAWSPEQVLPLWGTYDGPAGGVRGDGRKRERHRSGRLTSTSGAIGIRRATRAFVRFHIHIHADFEFVVAPTLDYAAHRTHVTVIPAPGERDVTLERNQIIGRIHVQPTGAGAIDRHPGVRSIRAHQPGAPGRRVGPQISAHIPRGAGPTIASTRPAGERNPDKRRACERSTSSGGVRTLVAFESKRKSLWMRAGQIQQRFGQRPAGAKRTAMHMPQTQHPA